MTGVRSAPNSAVAPLNVAGVPECQVNVPAAEYFGVPISAVLRREIIDNGRQPAVGRAGERQINYGCFFAGAAGGGVGTVPVGLAGGGPPIAGLEAGGLAPDGWDLS